MAVAAVSALAVFGATAASAAPASHAAPVVHAVHAAKHPPFNQGTVVKNAAPLGTVTRPNAKGQYHRLAVSPGVPTPTAWANDYWNGYAVNANNPSDDPITSVTGTFTVPTIDCADSYIGTSGTAYYYEWVGIDGADTYDVDQTGLAAYCGGTFGDLGSGSPTYYLWYDTCCGTGSAVIQYPGQPTVHAGDTLKFSVTFSTIGDYYSYTVVDESDSNWTETEAGTCTASSCPNQTAEAIVEQPGGDETGYPIPEFSSTSFSGLQVCTADSSCGGMDSLSGEYTWFDPPFIMSLGNPGIVSGDSTTTEGYPSSLSGTNGTAFSIDSSYWNSIGAANAVPYDPSSEGVAWLSYIVNANGDYAVDNGHNNRVTWSSSPGSGLKSIFIGLKQGVSSHGYDEVEWEGANSGNCLDDGSGNGHVTMESCISTDTDEQYAEAYKTSGYEMGNVGTGTCMDQVTGTGNYVNDATCPGTFTAPWEWNSFWYTSG